MTFVIGLISLSAQDVRKIQFCGSEYGNAGDSIAIKFNVIDAFGGHAKIRVDDLYKHLSIYENGKRIPTGDFLALSGGIRIPKETTISILVDQGIDSMGKQQIFEAIRNLVNSAPDSCIFLSFYGKETTPTSIITKENYDSFRAYFDRSATEKYFYDALFIKLLEFNENNVVSRPEYSFEPVVGRRASANADKNAMFLFVDGRKLADSDDNSMNYLEFTQGVKDLRVKPKIYAFYYTSGSDLDEDVDITLNNITGQSETMSFPLGKYVSTDDHQEILLEIGKAIEEQKYDFTFIYKASLESYNGRTIFSAKWDDVTLGDDAEFSIGTQENPWPIREETTADFAMKFFMALLVAFLTIAIFFIIMKILVPLIKSKAFSAKYYKRYKAEYGIQTRICNYCKQPLEEGQMVVTKCKHIMHVHCWKENEYRCAEYGQNCNIGIQDYVDWTNLLTKSSFRDCHQAISGICAGFISWIVYELMGRGIFHSLSENISGMFLTDELQRNLLYQTCNSKVASFFAIGMLLGLFLSLVFRLNEEYRKKDTKIYMKIIGLSLLSSFIGFLAFAFGGIMLCMLVASFNTTSIPWYCSLPAYILFSVCTSLSLTLKTSIPVKSAVLGGGCSSLIGFLVLYFTEGISNSYPWMNMLLDFIIYGGGLGASLITVRMLAEKYFLVIKNGVKSGTRIPIHKWMNATGGGNKVTIGMTGDCEIQMNWEKGNKVAKEHAILYIDQTKSIPVIKPMATNVIYNSRVELPVRKPAPLANGDTFKIGDTIFLYEETD